MTKKAELKRKAQQEFDEGLDSADDQIRENDLKLDQEKQNDDMIMMIMMIIMKSRNMAREIFRILSSRNGCHHRTNQLYNRTYQQIKQVILSEI
jgi:hypothetical protein